MACRQPWKPQAFARPRKRKRHAPDLVEFITKYPHRLEELTTIVMTHPRGELTGMLETACGILGHTWSGLEWVKGNARPAASQDATKAPADAHADGPWPFQKASTAQAKPPKAKRTKDAAEVAA